MAHRFDPCLGLCPFAPRLRLRSPRALGYGPDPPRAVGSLPDFATAAERPCLLVRDAGRVADGEAVLDAGCGFGGTGESLNGRLSGVELVGLTSTSTSTSASASCSCSGQRAGWFPGRTTGSVGRPATLAPCPWPIDWSYGRRTYGQLARRHGFELVSDQDNTCGTLPTYPLVADLFAGIGAADAVGANRPSPG